MQEPLIHFAINCASLSCPALLNEAYKPETLNTQLKDVARRFVSDGSRNQFLPAPGKVELSKIFDWYGDDFVERYGAAKPLAGRSRRESAVIGFLKEYASGANRQLLESNQFSQSYLPYDLQENTNPQMVSRLVC